MARWEQYEIWILPEGNSKRWEMVAAFSDFEVASAVAKNRTRRMRLIHSIYEENQPIEQHVLAEFGNTREQP